MPAEFLSLITQIDENLKAEDGPLRDGACLEERDRIAYFLLDHADELPPGISAFSCASTSQHDSHYWVEIELPDGSQYVWDRTRQKIPSAHLTPLAEAAQVWPQFGKPDERKQFLPEQFE